MVKSNQIYQDFEGDPLAIDLVKSRKYSLIFGVLSSILHLSMYIIDSFMLIPFVISLCVANYFYQRSHPNSSFTQKVVSEFVGFFLISLPTVLFCVIFYLL